jgi:hypothetical protein
MNKIISYLAIVVLSVAGISVAAKETSTTSQKTLANVEAKTTALAKVVEKTEEIKVSTLEKIEKQLNELDAQKNERTKIEIERDRKSIEFWFAALAILTAIGALFPFLLGRKEKELLKLELAGVKNDRTDIQRMKDDVQKILNESKTDSAEIKAHKDELKLDREKIENRLPDTVANAFQKTTIIESADRVIKSPDSNSLEMLRAQAVKASEENDNDLALLLWKRVLKHLPNDAQASFYYAYSLQKKHTNIDCSLNTELDSICAAYSVAEQNDILENQGLKNFWIPNNWGNALADQAQKIASIEPNTAQSFRKEALAKYMQALQINPNLHEAINNCGILLADEASHVVKTDRVGAESLWIKAREKYTDALTQKPSMNTARYGLACLDALENKHDSAINQLDILRSSAALPKHWLEDQDLENIRKTDIYISWYKKYFAD